MEIENHKLATGVLTIDLAAIAQNYQNIKRYCQSIDNKTVVAAVVKANGYGLGMVEVTSALYKAGCELFYVATPDEAFILRKTFADIDIFVLDGFFKGAAQIYLEHRLIPCLATRTQIEAWHKFGKNSPCVIHFNTGIHRLGIELDEFKSIAPPIIDDLNVRHVMSHFASADWPEDAQNVQQVAKFEQIIEHLPNHSFSFGNSAGIALKTLQQIHSIKANILRPGVALWGVKTFADYPIELKPVVKLDVRVLQVSKLETGDMVGYGHFYTASKPMRTAIIAAGYADGLFRSLSSADGNGAYFYFNGHKLPLLGKVSMDMIVVDISSVPDGQIQEGDFVEVIGENISLSQMAQWADTIEYEILTSLGKRFLRTYI